MTTLIGVLRKVAGLFVDDGWLALAILVIVVLASLVAKLAPAGPISAGMILLVGCLGVLLGNVTRTSRLHRSRRSGTMTTQPSVRPLVFLSVVVVAASGLMPTRALSGPAVPEASARAPIARVTAPASRSTVIGALGVIEITGSTARLSCGDEDAKVLQTREQLARDAAIADAMRARLVREHFRFVGGPSAMLDLELAEQDFAAQRAEVRAVRQEVVEEEHELTTARCETPDADQEAFGLQPSATVEVRIELPGRYLSSLRQELTSGRDVVAVYAEIPLSEHSDAIATGPLASVASTLLDHEANVVVRARLPDALHRLHEGEIVAVEVQVGEATQ